MGRNWRLVLIAVIIGIGGLGAYYWLSEGMPNSDSYDEIQQVFNDSNGGTENGAETEGYQSTGSSDLGLLEGKAVKYSPLNVKGNKWFKTEVNGETDCIGEVQGDGITVRNKSDSDGVVEVRGTVPAGETRAIEIGDLTVEITGI